MTKPYISQQAVYSVLGQKKMSQNKHDTISRSSDKVIPLCQCASKLPVNSMILSIMWPSSHKRWAA